MTPTSRARPGRHRGSSIAQYGTLAVAQLAVGAAAIFARFALTGAGPVAVSALRLSIAATVLLVFNAALRLGSGNAARKATHTTNRAQLAIFVAAGVALAVHFGTWISSLQYTSVAISTLLVCTAPVWTAFYDFFACGRRFSHRAWAALAAGLLGLALVVGLGSGHAPIGGHARLGDGLALTGGAALAAYFLLIRRVRAVYDTRDIVTRTYSYAALALIIAAACARQLPPPLTDARAWTGIVAMAFVSQLLGHTAMNAALRWFTASAVAFTTLLEPVIAGALALVAFGEVPAIVSIAGGLLVLAAIALFLYEEARFSHSFVRETERSTTGIGAVQ